MIILSIIILLFLAYGSLIMYYWWAWTSIPEPAAPAAQFSTRVSVIIPARNEEVNIERLLASLEKQDYPAELIQLLVIDDHSTDRTAELIRQFKSVTLLSLTADGINSYKKKAIETGIGAATGELIITTDADCVAPSHWIASVVAFANNNALEFISAPVVIEDGNSLVEIFQAYDFAILQGITGASVFKRIHSMSNGANMAYSRKAFDAVNGFSDIDQLASGDDMLLMHKISLQYPGKTGYLKAKAAIIRTRPVESWKAFFNQRIRWASKATYYKDNRLLPILLLVYLFNLSFLLLAIGGCWDHQLWIYGLALWIAKTLIEFPFVRSVMSFFGKKSLLNYFFLLQPLHILYTIIAGFLGQVGKYEWKGRRVN